MNNWKKITALVLLVLFHFTGNAASAFVLCIEADGQISIESRSEICCTRETASPVEEGSKDDRFLKPAKAGSCGPCFDIPLLTVGYVGPLVRTEPVKLPPMDAFVSPASRVSWQDLSLVPRVFKPARTTSISTPSPLVLRI